MFVHLWVCLEREPSWASDWVSELFLGSDWTREQWFMCLTSMVGCQFGVLTSLPSLLLLCRNQNPSLGLTHPVPPSLPPFIKCLGNRGMKPFHRHAERWHQGQIIKGWNLSLYSRCSVHHHFSSLYFMPWNSAGFHFFLFLFINHTNCVCCQI